jgi:hypothetical protein
LTKGEAPHTIDKKISSTVVFSWEAWAALLVYLASEAIKKRDDTSQGQRLGELSMVRDHSMTKMLLQIGMESLEVRGYWRVGLVYLSVAIQCSRIYPDVSASSPRDGDGGVCNSIPSSW